MSPASRCASSTSGRARSASRNFAASPPHAPRCGSARRNTPPAPAPRHRARRSVGRSPRPRAACGSGSRPASSRSPPCARFRPATGAHPLAVRRGFSGRVASSRTAIPDFLLLAMETVPVVRVIREHMSLFQAGYGRYSGQLFYIEATEPKAEHSPCSIFRSSSPSPAAASSCPAAARPRWPSCACC